MAQTDVRRWATQTRAFTAVWVIGMGVVLVVAAAYLKLFTPEDEIKRSLLKAVVASEFVHIPAHLILYGTLTVGWYRLSGGRWLTALLAVLAVGVLQEAAQSLLFGRWF